MVFEIVVRGGWGDKFPPHFGGNQKFCWGKFLPGGGNLRRSDFNDSNFFQS